MATAMPAMPIATATACSTAPTTARPWPTPVRPTSTAMGWATPAIPPPAATARGPGARCVRRRQPGARRRLRPDLRRRAGLGPAPGPAPARARPPAATACGPGARPATTATATMATGCDAACAVEAGWGCAGVAPDLCAAVCGDGVILGAEACDDGDRDPGDGCSAMCAVEAGWTCTGAPSSCATTCGDGVVAGAEACDDGDLDAGDGCGATCAIRARLVRAPARRRAARPAAATA
jgi:cysteine-rich repeat protein